MILIGAVIAVLILLLRLLPSINWPASTKPGPLESKLADYVTSEWVRRHAAKQTNPLNLSPENLKAGQGDFEEHCATCHGLAGSGENRFEADFYPPVAKLTDDVQEWCLLWGFFLKSLLVGSGNFETRTGKYFRSTGNFL